MFTDIVNSLEKRQSRNSSKSYFFGFVKFQIFIFLINTTPKIKDDFKFLMKENCSTNRDNGGTRPT